MKSGSRQEWLLGISAFLVGAVSLSLLTIFQRSVLGTSISELSGYLIPVLFGGVCGEVIWLIYRHQRRSTDVLTQYRELLEEFLDHSLDIVQDVTIEGRFLYVNQTWVAILGYDRQNLDRLLFRDVVHPDLWPQCQDIFLRILNGEDIPEIETVLITRDGEAIPVKGHGHRHPKSNLPPFIRYFFRDVSERVRTKAQLELMGNVFDHTAEGIIITDDRLRILTVNQAFTEVTGYSLEEVQGKNPSLLKSGHHNHDFYEEMWTSIHETGHWQGEIWNRRKSGEMYPELLTISAIRGNNGIITNYVGVFTDITALKTTEERLRYLATHDPLTDLPNRILFLDRLQHAIERARRSRTAFAVLFLDLDHFKQINDTYGHTRGDILLQMVAERLVSVIRKSDTPARLGGDEFTVLLEDIVEPSAVINVADKIITAFDTPFDLRGELAHIRVSIGFSQYPKDGEDVNDLLRAADKAMYNDKWNKRSGAPSPNAD